MKFYVTVLSLILLKTIAFSQTKFLKQFNFDNGNYAIYLIDCKQPLTVKVKTDSFKDTIIDCRSDDNFQVAEVKMLNQLKKEWKGNRVNYKYNCWYDYFIYVVENDSVILKFEVNLKCSELIFKGTPYKINPTMITKYLPKFKVLNKQDATYKNISKAIKIWESRLKEE